ncbi:hypothetical protein LAJ19_20495 (plasmid) [Deinococcus taeanensis]|uniref:hypothetical protein n=1 Tax=Deinococcus taeanensis TaxID=2737050 RepID=UPI001CDC5B58|nr:hypothetical protein [Deinococcus taeanensis]UBV45190.1 hypothetical protein LAJ19_20495 [Deinococcus taeanensis]
MFVPPPVRIPVQWPRMSALGDQLRRLPPGKQQAGWFFLRLALGSGALLLGSTAVTALQRDPLLLTALLSSALFLTLLLPVHFTLKRRSARWVSDRLWQVYEVRQRSLYPIFAAVLLPNVALTLVTAHARYLISPAFSGVVLGAGLFILLLRGQEKPPRRRTRARVSLGRWSAP